MTIPADTSVIKVGGSVLRDARSYEVIARLLSERMTTEPTWVVVSAAKGVTDGLDRLRGAGDSEDIRRFLAGHTRATGVSPAAGLEAELRDGWRASFGGSVQSLFAWGERASTDALRRHLRRLGIEVPVIELPSRVRLPPVPSALVPGFYLRDRTGHVRCLPRGGSDISAVLVAAGLRSARVRLWKDGGGIRVGGESTVTEVDGASLLHRVRGSIRPLHPVALRIAIQRGIDLVLEDPFGRHASTLVSCRPGASARGSHGPPGIRVTLPTPRAPAYPLRLGSPE
ncbi:MAG TPA: hypothetical protein VK723_03475 [Thermoplasmata archaeon]|nr:hypothetical protein [Thermoplasmata archaeon]